ncbi:MAG: four helix bundle protein [Desulfobacteraceae bacterium]|nr:four helix bundle protein [Desulfobacteraceae bacterium]MBC2754912.1 four helix bundle protein [Desulfobacteraceae bacterium]
MKKPRPGSRGGCGKGDQGSGVRDQGSGGRRIQLIKSYRDLEVWQKSMDLVVARYQLTKAFPKNETYGLASQLQRAAVSVPSNIAEGRQRQHSKEFLQYLSMAYASLAELETHVQISRRLNYIDEHQVNNGLDKTAEIGRMINGLRKSVKNRIRPLTPNP